jgi:hypothetical protein
MKTAGGKALPLWLAVTLPAFIACPSAPAVRVVLVDWSNVRGRDVRKKQANLLFTISQFCYAVFAAMGCISLMHFSGSMRRVAGLPGAIHFFLGAERQRPRPATNAKGATNGWAIQTSSLRPLLIMCR